MKCCQPLWSCIVNVRSVLLQVWSVPPRHRKVQLSDWWRTWLWWRTYLSALNPLPSLSSWKSGVWRTWRRSRPLRLRTPLKYLSTVVGWVGLHLNKIFWSFCFFFVNLNAKSVYLSYLNATLDWYSTYAIPTLKSVTFNIKPKIH